MAGHFLECTHIIYIHSQCIK